MQIVKDPKINWLGMKWYFLSVSLVLVVMGVVSLLTAGFGFSVEFTGGTLVIVKFQETPDLARVRQLFSAPPFNAQGVSRFDQASQNLVQVRMPELVKAEGEDSDLGDAGKLAYDALKAEYDPDATGIDLNEISTGRLALQLSELGSEALGGASGGDAAAEEANGGSADAGALAQDLADRILSIRTQRGGLFSDFSDLDGLNLPQAVPQMLRERFYLGSFNLVSVESVGPKVGNELREKALAAVLFSLGGMLIYITFRFQLIYGVAALAALFHDVFITIGFFSISGKEISLTVIAALLTLVGYSLNDTIVVFDRVRENVRLMRRKSLFDVINASINQTLNRTILTSATFFMAALALFLFGGDALDGFSFALVIGVLVGTYSSVGIASTIVAWWDSMRQKRNA